MKKLLLGAGATAALLHSGFALSQVAAAAADAASGPTTSSQDLQSVIVTGTRTTGLKAVDSAAPVQVIDSGTLARTGQTDVMQALAAILPSFTAEAFGSDTAALTLSATLRGVSPNDTLVLVNGKRRHTTANLSVDSGSPYSGAATTDLSFIPLSAIDHVEVLMDGAAAQYGTDAIAGVVNIILKNRGSGGTIDVNGGGYGDGGGHTLGVTGNVGVRPDERSFVSLSGESKYHGHSDRGADDPKSLNKCNTVAFGTPGCTAADGNTAYQHNIVNFPGYPHVNRIFGDPAYHLNTLTLNAGYDFSEMVQAYVFATYGKKDAEAFENYRGPSRIPSVYPNGFNPEETLSETDYSVTAGLKGIAAGWNWDVSSTYGGDKNVIGTINSGNASLTGGQVPGQTVDPVTGTYTLAGTPTQTNFHDGNFRTQQFTNNLDISHEFDVSMATPLTVAVGGEQRADLYEITAGDPEASVGSGAQSFQGYNAANSGRYLRHNVSGYIDFAVSPVKELQVDAAARLEHYSDFGSTHVGKLTMRYDFTPTIALRGTVSNGFRAPTLAEEFYSGNNVGPDSILLQLPPNSAAAKALGVDNLKPEKSINYSLGLVAHPLPSATVTVDAYQIAITNRIVATSGFYGYNAGAFQGGNPNNVIVQALTAAGIPTSVYQIAADGQGGVQFYTNGADTRTRGIDLVGSYGVSYGDLGNIDWSLGGNYTLTKVTKNYATPKTLTNLDPTGTTISATVLNQSAKSVLETAIPKFRLTGGALWRLGQWSVSVRETLFGPSSYITLDGDNNQNYKTTISTKLITDLEVADEVTRSITVAIGAKNLFNTYPQKQNSQLLQNYRDNGDNSAVAQYPSSSPFGVNGGYYYARASYKF